MVAILFVLRVNLVSKFDMLESLSETENISEHSMFRFVPLKLTSTGSVQFMTSIFRLDSFTLS